MPDDTLPNDETRPGHGAFLTTRWSMVLQAGTGDSPQALTQLCRDYWYPVYAFMRRRGLGTHDAQDSAQAFFLELIGSNLLTRATEERGRFRSYLLGAVKNFLANEHRRQQTQKRGGGETIISVDALEAEERFALEPKDVMTPERQFERSWAFKLLEGVMKRLEEDYREAGRETLFEKLQPYLAGKAQLAGYGELGRELQMSEGTVAVAIHRMRKRYGELLRGEIAHTVGTPEEVEGEIAYLLEVVSG